MTRRPNPRSHDYQGQHSPPGPEDVADGTAAPFHAIESVMPDYYAHPNWYRTGGDREWEATGPILAARNQPTKPVKIYRAVPLGVKTINPGDWVTQSRGYAKEHLQSNLDGQGKILSTTAKASSLFTNGDSHFEWGWWPDPARELAERNTRSHRICARIRAEREVVGVRKNPRQGIDLESRAYAPPDYSAELAREQQRIEDARAGRRVRLDLPAEAVVTRQKVRKNPHYLYHGGRLAGPLEVRPHAKGRGEHGAGIYTTTSWSTARTFSRGGAIFRLTLTDKITWLDGVALPLGIIRKFLAELPRLKNRKEIDADLAKAAARQVVGSPFPLLWLHNILINNDATVGQNGPAITKFLINNGVDAAYERAKSDEDWVVIFNPDIVLKVEKLDPRKVGKDYPFDQPRVRRNPPTPLAAILERLLAQVRAYPPITLEVGPAAAFPKPRNRAYVDMGEAPDAYTIVVAPALVREAQARQEGVLRHEVAHVLLDWAGQPDHTERDADDFAEALFGARIRYDRDDIQTTGPGAHPRPARLPG